MDKPWQVDGQRRAAGATRSLFWTNGHPGGQASGNPHAEHLNKTCQPRMNKHWLGGFPQNRASNHQNRFSMVFPQKHHTLGVYSSWVNNDHDLPTTRGFYGDFSTASITRGEGFARIRLDSSLVQLRPEMRPSTCQIQIPTGRGKRSCLAKLRKNPKGFVWK